MTAERKVKCAKFGVPLPGLKRKPFQDDLGQRLYDCVSQDAWNLWLKEMTKLINEYRLSMAKTEHQDWLKTYMKHYFFGEGELPQPPTADDARIKFTDNS